MVASAALIRSSATSLRETFNPGLRRDLGDPGAHLPGADDADLLDVESHISSSKRPSRPGS